MLRFSRRQLKRLEQIFEQLLWRLRLITILPVIFSLASSFFTFVLGTREIAMAMLTLIHDKDYSTKDVASLLAGIVSGIDLYLIGVALLIFGYGIYELLISPLDAAHAEDRAGEGLLEIRDLDQLKEKLVKVLVVALIVTAFKTMLTLEVKDSPSLTYFCLSVLLLAISGFLVTGHLGQHGRGR